MRGTEHLLYPGVNPCKNHMVLVPNMEHAARGVALPITLYRATVEIQEKWLCSRQSKTTLFLNCVSYIYLKDRKVEKNK